MKEVDMSDITNGHIPTEEEMSVIRRMFERGANAIVEATTLAKKVDAMEKELAEVKHEVEYVRGTNRYLTEELTRNQQQITELQHKVNEQGVELNRLRQQLAQKDDEIASLQSALAAAQETNVRLIRESNEHMDRAIAAEETNHKLKNKLEEALVWASEVEDVIRPKVEEVPEVTSPVPTDVPSMVEHRETYTPPSEQLQSSEEEPSPMPLHRYGFGA
jgi:chromosome segregation ATPase